MSEINRGRAVFKCIFWTAVVVLLYGYAWHTYTSGKMAEWYYHTASEEGYAVNAELFKNATKENPAILTVGQYDTIDGLVAVPVKKGDRLPIHANGVILNKVIEEGERVTRDGENLKVSVPWKIKESKGFKYKDTFKHKGVKTNPWSGPWNVAIVLLLGLALGMMAEGFTDIFGLKLEKNVHSH